jgi:hypothetical protein
VLVGPGVEPRGSKFAPFPTVISCG